MNLAQIGLKCTPDRTRINGSLTYEVPVNLTLESEWNGPCTVGAFTYINPFGEYNTVDIGRYCSIAKWVIIGPGQHNTSNFSTHPFVGDPKDTTANLSEYEAYQKILSRTELKLSKTQRSIQNYKIRIGHDVWIGTRAIIMQGVSIGNGAVIAAGAIVTKDVPPYAIVGGVPARVLKYRFDAALIEEFIKSEWWEYDMSQVTGKVDYSNPKYVLSFIERLKSQGIAKRFTTPRIMIERSGTEYKITQIA